MKPLEVIKWARRSLYVLLFIPWYFSLGYLHYPFVISWLMGISCLLFVGLSLPEWERYPKVLVLQPENNIQS